MRVQGNDIPKSIIIDDSPKQGYSIVRISDNAEQIKDNLYEYDEYVFTVPSKYADVETITANFAEWIASGKCAEVNRNASELYYQQQLINTATSYLDDEQAESVTALFEEWHIEVAYKVGDRRQYDGLLYRCVQAHTSQADWTPPAVPALWVRTSTDPFPEWIQPQGAHDAYPLGAKVSHLGKHWISTIDANVYEPSVYGWDEVTT